ISRREFIQNLSLSAAAMALVPGVARAQRRGGVLPAGAPQKTVLFGGRVAGLSARLELKRAGHKIIILGHPKTPRGRRGSTLDLADGQYAEAGPLSFPPSHSFTFGYVMDFGLPVRPAFTFGLDTIANLHGNRFRINSSGSADIPLSLSSLERQAGVYGMP